MCIEFIYHAKKANCRCAICAAWRDDRRENLQDNFEEGADV